MIDSRLLRIRALLDRQFEVVVVGLVVLAAIGGVLTYGAYADPNTSVQQTEVRVMAANGAFTHQSTVVNNETLTAGAFEPGATVTNRTVYYQSIMPVLDGTFTYGYTADSGSLETVVQTQLVVRSVDQRNDQSVEYWRVTRPLGDEERTVTLAPGTRAVIPFSVNISEVTQTADRIHEQVGDPGQTRVSLNVSVAVSGNAGGQEVDRTFAYGLPLEVDDNLYRVEGGGGAPTVTRTEQTTVTDPPGPLAAYGSPVLFVLSVAGLAGLVYARRDGRLTLTDAERTWLTYRDDRSDFDDWISTVRIPPEARSFPVAEADSLADLVNVAIDTDSAVLESPDDGAYHVLHDGVRYTFTPPPPPVADDPSVDD